jgi:hypothetical protein
MENTLKKLKECIYESRYLNYFDSIYMFGDLIAPKLCKDLPSINFIKNTRAISVNFKVGEAICCTSHKRCSWLGCSVIVHPRFKYSSISKSTFKQTESAAFVKEPLGLTYLDDILATVTMSHVQYRYSRLVAVHHFLRSACFYNMRDRWTFHLLGLN